MLQAEAAAIINIPVTESFNRAVDLIHNAVHIKKGKLVSKQSPHRGEYLPYDYNGEHYLRSLYLTYTVDPAGESAIKITPLKVKVKQQDYNCNHGSYCRFSEGDIIEIASDPVE